MINKKDKKKLDKGLMHHNKGPFPCACTIRLSYLGHSTVSELVLGRDVYIIYVQENTLFHSSTTN